MSTKIKKSKNSGKEKDLVKLYGPIGTVPLTPSGKEERKWRVRALSSDFPSVGTANVYRNLAALGAGTDYYNRIGRRVVVDFVDVIGTLVGGQANSVADDPYNTIQIALVRAVPTFAPSTDWSVTTPIGPQQVPGVIKVLWYWRGVICANAKDSTGYVAKAHKIAVRIPVHLPYEWTSASDTAASNEGLFLVMCSDSVAVANPGFNSGLSMIVYHDA